MKVVDLNVLLYATNSSGPHHERSRSWLDRALSGHETIGFSWIVLLGFVRLSTKIALFPSPLSIADSMQQIDEWLASPSAVIVEPTANHARVLRQLLDVAGTGGNLVSDAHLAALAIEHRSGIVSYDRDFARFPGITCELPPEHSSPSE